MLRSGLKFPCHGLSSLRKQGISKLHLPIRCYETGARIRLEQNQRFNKDAKLLRRPAGQAKFSSNASESGSKSKGMGIPAFVAVTIGISGGILLYAKYDPQFRATLEQYIPGTDRAVGMLFFENFLPAEDEHSNDVKSSGLNVITGAGSKEKAGPVSQSNIELPLPEAAKPKLAEPVVTLAEKKEQPSNEPSRNVHARKEEHKAEGAGKASSFTIVELEKDCSTIASNAIALYDEARKVNQSFNEYVISALDSGTSAGDKAVWQRLKDESEKRKEHLEKLDRQANEALATLSKLSGMIEEKRFETSPSLVNSATANVKKLIDSVHRAKTEFEKAAAEGSLSEKYWQNIRAARDAFKEELHILFPDFNIEDRKLGGSGEAFDLFVLYMYNKVNRLQRELEKRKTLDEMKLQAALRGSADDAAVERSKALVDLHVGMEKKALQEEFEKKILEEEKNYADKLRQQLKLQLQIHADHLREALAEKEREHQRQLNRAVSEQSMNDQEKHNIKFATVVGRIRALEKTLKGVLEEERKATNLQILWSSCQALVRALKHGPPGVSPNETIKPLEPMIKAISKAAPQDDPLVVAAIRSIPEVATKRGVYPESALRQRFLKVENVARKLAMVPAEGASLPVYFLSYLQSLLIINSGYSISKNELQDTPIDVDSLNTYEILNRARYWIDQGDFKMSLRYMNLLKGAPRSVARDWMNEVRILLETQQAVNIFNAYAGALGLTFIIPDSASAKTPQTN